MVAKAVGRRRRMPADPAHLDRCVASLLTRWMDPLEAASFEGLGLPAELAIILVLVLLNGVSPEPRSPS
jgi:hypothetical protein